MFGYYYLYLLKIIKDNPRISTRESITKLINFMNQDQSKLIRQNTKELEVFLKQCKENLHLLYNVNVTSGDIPFKVEVGESTEVLENLSRASYSRMVKAIKYQIDSESIRETINVSKMLEQQAGRAIYNYHPIRLEIDTLVRQQELAPNKLKQSQLVSKITDIIEKNTNKPSFFNRQETARVISKIFKQNPNTPINKETITKIKRIFQEGFQHQGPSGRMSLHWFLDAKQSNSFLEEARGINIANAKRLNQQVIVYNPIGGENEICSAFIGEKFDADDASNLPEYHPNCKCSVVPFNEELDDIRDFQPMVDGQLAIEYDKARTKVRGYEREYLKFKNIDDTDKMKLAKDRVRDIKNNFNAKLARDMKDPRQADRLKIKSRFPGLN